MIVEELDEGTRILSVCEVLVERIFGSLQFRFCLFTELGRSSVKSPLGRCHELCGNEDGFLHVLTLRGGPKAGIHVARIIVVRVRVSAVHLLGRRCESKWQREFENSSKLKQRPLVADAMGLFYFSTLRSPSPLPLRAHPRALAAGFAPYPNGSRRAAPLAPARAPPQARQPASGASHAREGPVAKAPSATRTHPTPTLTRPAPPNHPRNPTRRRARSPATASTRRAARISRPCGSACPRSSSSAGSPAASPPFSRR